MASIAQAAKKVSFSLTRPLVKLMEGGTKVPLSTEEKGRLPPGQFATDRFGVLHHESDDEIPAEKDLAGWTLTVDGAVETPITLAIADLKKLPIVHLTSDFHCVTSWSRFDNQWTGVRVRDVLALAKPKKQGRFLTQHAWSGHTTSTPLPVALADDAIIAWEQEGKPLTREHGWPIRVIIPTKYAYKGVKWLKRLTLTTDEELGFWEVRGYSQAADPWKNDRYS